MELINKKGLLGGGTATFIKEWISPTLVATYSVAVDACVRIKSIELMIHSQSKSSLVFKFSRSFFYTFEFSDAASFVFVPE